MHQPEKVSNSRSPAIQRAEGRTERFMFRLRPSELASMQFLAAENDRSVSAEMREAVNGWLLLAPWLEAAMKCHEDEKS
jgi:hypothetical protein